MIKKRNNNLDIARTVAFVLLITLHFFLNTGFYQTLVDSKRMYLAIMLRTICMSCIPIFLMLTGYLKCNKKYDKKYFDGLFRIIFIYVICMIFNYTFFHFFDKSDLTIKSLLKSILSFADSAWYINMYIGLYLISPILNIFLQNTTKKQQKNMILILFFLISVPTIINIWNFDNGFLGFINSVIYPSTKIIPDWWANFYPTMYYLIGAYVCLNKVKIPKKNNLLFLIISIIIASLFNIYKSHNSIFLTGSWADWNSILTLTISSLIFIFIVNNEIKLSDLCKKIFEFVSKYSYAAYLVLPCCERVVYRKINFLNDLFIFRFNYILIAVFVLLISSLIISYLLTNGYSYLCKKLDDKKMILIPLVLAIIIIPLSISLFENNIINRNKWLKYKSEQLLGNEQTGTLFDPSVLIDDGIFKMYVSSRKDGSIVLYTSKNGVDFDPNYKVIIKSDDPDNYIYNRPSILKHDEIYYLYYTKQLNNKYSEIHVAKSNDGIHFEHQDEPILTATLDFEGTSVMNPNVIYDNLKKEFRMYYVSGEIFEPDYICLAHSNDGINWTKNTEPILQKNSNLNSYDHFKVGATDVHIVDNVYYMFYIGYTDIHTGRILFATSNDGVNFDRDNAKLIAEADPEGFDKDSVYKPSAVFNKKDNTWYLYYNGRTAYNEYIGLYTKKGYKIK